VTGLSAYCFGAGIILDVYSVLRGFFDANRTALRLVARKYFGIEVSPLTRRTFLDRAAGERTPRLDQAGWLREAQTGWSTNFQNKFSV
jgi:hypothetical protein